MINFKESLEQHADKLSETIEHVIIGNSRYFTPLPTEYVNTPLLWEDVKYLLDYEYEDDFGPGTPHPIYAYTESYVIFVAEYDSSFYLVSVPRNPQPCEPIHI